MNWDAIGAVGEVVGALGVLITLIYLANQIRLNSKLLRYSVQENTSQNTRDQFHLFQDAFSREAILKSFHTDEDISLEQSTAAEAFMMGSMASFQSQFLSYRNGLLSEKEWALVRQSISFFFTTSWPRAWWESASAIYDQEFAEIVSELVRNTPLSGTHLTAVMERAKQIRVDGT